MDANTAKLRIVMFVLKRDAVVVITARIEKVNVIVIKVKEKFVKSVRID